VANFLDQERSLREFPFWDQFTLTGPKSYNGIKIRGDDGPLIWDNMEIAINTKTSTTPTCAIRAYRTVQNGSPVPGFTFYFEVKNFPNDNWHSLGTFPLQVLTDGPSG
jgi:hypothetical protein